MVVKYCIKILKIPYSGDLLSKKQKITLLECTLSYIKTSHWSIEEISCLLGFQEPASFSHAFKRWTGTSPSTFRNEARDDSPPDYSSNRYL
ncbi:MAG: AraC family transcriptional regulator [SAR324 cluster bacterium]|nr:AraC family transcriptional regulator [SAR324 cluster bacterium]